jgi:tartrate-resistant acid phosphatase type 5
MKAECIRKNSFKKAGMLFLAIFFNSISLPLIASPLHCQSSADGSKRCFGNSADKVQFIAFGDGGAGTPDQVAVAKAMQAKCSAEPCQFGLLLGDNFYPNGVKDVNDPLFQDYFEKIYKAVSFPFYPVVGNHDEKGSIQAQLDYTGKSKKWFFPSRYYSHAYPEDGSLVEFFAIDSSNFDKVQASWLEKSLAMSKARWKILYDHFPFYSNGKHGDNSGNIATLVAPLVCGKIDLVLSGHDHDKEHLLGQTGSCKFQQLIVGTGGKSLYEVHPDKRTLFSASSYGFAWFSVEANKMKFEIMDTTGKVEYSYTMKK